MDDVTWVAARAAQAVSRHLNAAESEAARFATRLRREPVTAVQTAVPANEAPRVRMAMVADDATRSAGSRTVAA